MCTWISIFTCALHIEIHRHRNILWTRTWMNSFQQSRSPSSVHCIDRKSSSQVRLLSRICHPAMWCEASWGMSQLKEHSGWRTWSSLSGWFLLFANPLPLQWNAIQILNISKLLLDTCCENLPRLRIRLATAMLERCLQISHKSIKHDQAQSSNMLKHA